MRRSNSPKRPLVSSSVKILRVAAIAFVAVICVAHLPAQAQNTAQEQSQARATAQISESASTIAPLPMNVRPVPLGEAIITLMVNGNIVGDVETRIDMDNPFIRIGVLRDALAEYLEPKRRSLIFDVLYMNLEWVGPEDLTVAGIRGIWDINTLQYDVQPPAAYSRIRLIDFSTRSPYRETEYFKPSLVAGAVNFTGSSTIQWDAISGGIPVAVDADGYLGIWKVVAEYGGTLQYSAANTSWSWYKAKGIFDIPAIEGRVSFGKVTAEGFSFLARPSLYGAIIRTQDIFSKYDRKNSPAISFALEKTSIVRILSNGQVIRTLKLEKGTYRIFDLPFTYGLNSISLEVEDDNPDGVKIYRTIQPFISTESGLLVGGAFDYGASAGVSETDTNEPIGSFFLRYGTSYNMTSSLFAAVDAYSAMAGTSVVYGSPIGVFSGEVAGVAAWDNRAELMTVAAELRYQFNHALYTYLPAFELQASWNSYGFSAPSAEAFTGTLPDSYLRISASIGRTLARTASISLAGRWSRRLTSILDDAFAATLNMGVNLGRGVGITMSTTGDFGTTSGFKVKLNLGMTASDPVRSSSRISLSQVSDGTNSITYSDRIPLPDAPYYTIQATNIAGHQSERSSLSVSSSYSGRLGSISGSNQVRFDTRGGAVSGTSNIRLATAIAFADLAVGIAPSINEGFVVFAPDRSTAGMAVAFATETSRKYTTHGLPIAIPLSSYRQTRASMDFPEADVDVAATVPQSVLNPGYRSGFVYRAGLLKKFYVNGRVLDESGKIVPFLGAEVLDLNGQLLTETFTDDTGAFQIYGLTKGRYMIRWTGDYRESQLTLKDSKDGYVDAGDLVVLRKPVGEGAK